MYIVLNTYIVFKSFDLFILVKIVYNWLHMTEMMLVDLLNFMSNFYTDNKEAPLIENAFRVCISSRIRAPGVLLHVL